MELTTHKCDECGAIKQDANHWWRLQVFVRTGEIYVTPWHVSDYVARQASEPEHHYCGRECVLKAISKAMEER